jgi:predicted Zn-dependent protease
MMLLRASVLNSAGRTAEARAVVSRVTSREPNNVDALLVLAGSAAIEGKDREQRTLLERVVQLDNRNLKALSDLGYIALRSQSLRVAAGHFDRALAVNESYREALVGRAIVYRYARDPANSERLLNRAIRQNPDWASPLNERARLYKGAGFLEDALRDLDAAKRLEPGNYWVSVDRASTLLDMNRRREALEELNVSVTLDPGNFLAYVYRAGLRDQFGDYAGAEQDYATLMRIKPDYYFAAEGLGVIKMRNKQYTEARDAFLAAYRQAPKEYRYALLAAVNWMKAGRPADPKQFLAQVLRTAPRNSADWHLLRLFHDFSGDVDMAARAEQEQNLDTKTRMLFYLANFYDIRGNQNTAIAYLLQVREMNRRGIIEWNINEMLLAEREQ